MNGRNDYGEPDHGIRGILFDLDGVLVDAAEWHKDAFNEALIENGAEPIGDEEHYRDFDGLSTRRKLEMLKKDGRVGNIEDKIHVAKQRITVEMINERCEPIDRVIKVVNYADKHFLTAVVTNCVRASAELMLKKANLFHRFDLIITNEDVDGKIKPHPWPYLKAKYGLGLNYNKQCLAIDDTNRGIISSVEAFCRTWKLKKYKDLTEKNLIHVLDSYRITL